MIRLLLVGVALAVDSGVAARAGQPTEAEAVAALERLGAKINGANPKNAADRPVRGVLFPRKNCAIADADLAHLKAMPDLEYAFVLGQTKVTGDGLRHLAGLRKLATLDFDGTPIEGRHLAHLKDMRQLHKLGLWRTGVDDAGMAHLMGLSNLEHLYLDKTVVGDDGVAALGPNPSLCDVTWGGSRVTARGEAILRKNLPRLGSPPLRGD